MSLLPALVVCAALSIGCSSGSGDDGTPSAEPQRAAASSVPRPVFAVDKLRGFALTSVDESAPDLAAALRDHVRAASAAELRPFVELWASWCEPCMAIRAAMDDPRMVAAFRGSYVVALDVDDWGPRLPEVGLAADSIPVFFELGPDARPTGRSIDGGAWGENIPANMAPPLDRFFHGH